MNKKEALMILAVLKAAYPIGFRDMGNEDNVVLVNLWVRIFADWPYENVSRAVDSVIVINKTNFPPSPGAVMDQLIKNTSPPEMTEMEAWELVFRAIKNSAWHAQEEYQKLPSVVKKCVGSPEMLQSWAGMDAETVNSVIQSNFMRTLRNRKEQDREYLALPKEVKNKILALSEGIGA